MDYGKNFGGFFRSFFIFFSCKLAEACPQMQEPTSTGGLARDVWEINHKDIKLTDRLGKGMFGEVRQFPTDCNDFPTISNYYPRACNHFPTIFNYFPTACNHFPTISNYFPTACNHFPTISHFFPTSCNHFPIIFQLLVIIFQQFFYNFPTACNDFTTISNYFPTACNHFKIILYDFPTTGNHFPTIFYYFPNCLKRFSNNLQSFFQPRQLYFFVFLLKSKNWNYRSGKDFGTSGLKLPSKRCDKVPWIQRRSEQKLK